MALQLLRPRRSADGRHADVAHVLRRVGFDPPHSELIARLDDPTSDVIDDLLDRSPASVATPTGDGDDGEVDAAAAVVGVADQLLGRTDPLHERMTWFWHTHFTTSLDRVHAPFVWNQYLTFRQHALGNFRDLVVAIATGPAMLLYLDGAGSQGDDPNENFAREFLELFTLGRNNGYTEGDIRAGARVFAGWDVDWDTATSYYEPDSAYGRPVTFLGERRRWTAAAAVEHVCSLTACHRHVVRRIHLHLVGVEPSEQRVVELAERFAADDLEIRPLVAAILRSDDFLVARPARARQPLEWLIAVMRAIGVGSIDELGLSSWDLLTLGQAPFHPPNVGGWPLDDRWLQTGNVLARLQFAVDLELPDRLVDAVEPTVDAVLRRCGLFDVTGPTREALDLIERRHSEFDARLELLLSTTMITPEFCLL